MIGFRATALALLLAFPTTALAHAGLASIDPGRDTVVAGAPESVTLHFTEPVEVRFAGFEVHPLAVGLDAADTEPDFLRLDGLAATLASEALDDPDDEEVRADAGVATTEARATEVVLTLKPDLAPGPYAVLWRVLSVDGHVTQGHAVFVIEGASR